MIEDWRFYAVAIPAVLILGLSKSGFASGFGLLAVPLMSTVVPVPDAAAIMMPVLLVVDVMGLAAYRPYADWTLIRYLVPLGLAGTVLGTLVFKLVDSRYIAGVVGVMTLLFLLQRLIASSRAEGNHMPRWLGGALAVVAGFTSFVAHAGSPPFNAYVAPIRLAPLVFTGTSAVFFSILNLSKWGPYAWLGLLDMRNMSASLVLLPFAAAGLLVGLKIATKIQPRQFYALVYAGMLVSGLKLIWDAGLTP